MAKDFDAMEDSNRSSNPSIHEVSDPARRRVLRGTAAALARWAAPAGAATVAATVTASLAGCAAPGGGPGAMQAQAASPFGFKAVPAGSADRVVVPPGYTATPLLPWGEPVGIAGRMPAFHDDASNSAADQAAQMGMHHDGLQFFPIDGSSTHGLLVMNHEYTDEGLLHATGPEPRSAEKVRKSQAAIGISVTEVRLANPGSAGARWEAVRPSKYARRLTAYSPFALAGPAAGHPMLRTAADPAARVVLGTLNDCASSMTPWGTYLAGEENWAGYFTTADQPTAHERRFGLAKAGYGLRWHEHDERFDTVRHPNEANRFGWIVEVDPFDPAAVPVKRTALGRGAREGAWVTLTRDGRAVVYSGEDARFEYLYKFVSRDTMKPATAGVSAARANAGLLDHGTLYVARFDANGRGRWLPMVAGQGPLIGFPNQGEVMVKARQVADLLGGTKMDRPEWIAIDPRSRWVSCTLTHNASRGGAGQPGPDAANPRANNTMGSIIRWREDGDFDGEAFEWNHLVLAGDPANERAEAKGTVRGDAFACPDGLAIDPLGRLWVQTDISASALNKGEMARLGNNAMLACDVASGEFRRFLVGPVNCEVTGAAFTPDARTLFVNIQHPGEPPGDSSDPRQPRRYSNWPDFKPNGRPRSATVVVRKDDGGVIGS
ncbi:MAG: PhoX family phosphatase [Rubrivivax sp.]|nr:PhoX family phosphatase [Rubrivivax sp.]